jgi:type I restriction enzyme S subunit
MKGALTRYSAYHPSPVRWISELPAHWRGRRIKTFLREVDVRSGTGAGALLTMRRTSGLIPLSDVSNKLAEPDRLRHYKLAKTGDIVMNPMQAGNGMFAICKTPGLISPDYRAFELTDEADPNYLIALFKSEAMRATFRAESKGLGTGTAGFLRLYPDRFGSLFAPFPPAVEQRLVAGFIDAYTAQVERLLAAKRRTMAVLIERKQVIFTDILRLGLDEQAVVTGDLHWIDQRPKRWRVNRLKPFVQNVTEVAKATDENEYVITLDGVESWTGRVVQTSVNMDEAFVGKRFLADDVLFGKLRPYLAKVVRPTRFGLAGTEFLVLRSDKSNISPRFLEQLIRSKPFIDFVSSLSVGAKMPRTEWEFVSSVNVALPELSEQERICDHFAATSLNIDRALDQCSREIKLILEYRGSMIAAIVTGRLDVRGAEVAVVEGAETMFDLTSDDEDMEDALEPID